ncbi:cytochrome c3 family protein, partial [Nitrolancea hollandica]|uniref:cytochrome c3 family protein n=1 Tax=Nitrolancea hollandica TaxID=1206749 RepID=UPI001566D0D9
MQRYLRASVVVVIILLLLAIPITAVLARSYFLSPTAYPTPTQPILFPHSVHVTGLGLDCTFCHRFATDQALVNVSGATTPVKGDFTEETWGNAYVPALQQCMFCH